MGSSISFRTKTCRFLCGECKTFGQKIISICLKVLGCSFRSIQQCNAKREQLGHDVVGNWSKTTDE